MQGLLIAGTSHCGKSTLAQRVGAALGWRVTSTDKMGRHPGRPWPSIPAPVEEYYEALTDETIYWFLRVHHTNMWPLLVREIAAQVTAGGGFVFEGSALRPESIATLNHKGVAAVCLYADQAFLAERMRQESGYASKDDRQKLLIDKFIARSLRDSTESVEAARAHGIPIVDVADAGALEETAEQLVARASG
ncbi:hypothetical protein [Devosia nitrariae]|uniref:AAA domain-containing protein n=1 Tax=Devosia nitrariae TaxID=2071872 RepID=A0ABQ5W1G4_9HYPH|nr:hypothetical protein [Devosia nitrariae]GLQ53688.1 hypothetical protein GCM10010862_09470 [Devosia nitrariae]